jgi:hypothetical protein
MSKSNTLETGWLNLLFANTNLANIGDATGLRASTTAGSLFISLHTADPGESGGGAECAYTGYGRVGKTRSATDFTVSGDAVTMVSAATFGACTAGSETAIYAGIWTASTGGTLLISGPLGSALGLATATVADTFTIPGLTGLAVNDRIAFNAVPWAALPVGMTEGVAYFVKTLSGNDITISTTSGGATLDITTAGAAIAFKVTPIVIAPGVTPSIPAGVLFRED